MEGEALRLDGNAIGGMLGEMFVHAEIGGLRIVQRCDDVPGSAPADHMVERCEDARHDDHLSVQMPVPQAA